MPQANSLSVIIPAYNESRRLPNTVRHISAYLRSRALPHELIVVDDGSRDDTPQLLEALKEEHNITVLGDGHNRGKGMALRAGALAAKGQYVLMTDADLSTPIEEVTKLMPRVTRDGYDVAIGSRALSSEVAQPLYRRVLSRLSNLLIRVVLGLPYGDTQCGFKLYRREAARELFGELNLPRFSFDYEVLLRAQRRGLRVAEVGVRWEHSPYTTVTSSDVLQCLVDVFRLRFAMDSDGGIRALPGGEVLRFVCVGIINTLVDAGMYVTLTRITSTFAEAPVMAKFAGFVVASAVSFVLNRYWTFGIRSQVRAREVVRFYLAQGLSLGVNVGTMYALVYGLHMYDLLALAITTGVTFGINYTLSKMFVFKESPTKAVLTTV